MIKIDKTLYTLFIFSTLSSLTRHFTKVNFRSTRRDNVGRRLQHKCPLLLYPQRRQRRVPVAFGAEAAGGDATSKQRHRRAIHHTREQPVPV